MDNLNTIGQDESEVFWRKQLSSALSNENHFGAKTPSIDSFNTLSEIELLLSDKFKAYLDGVTSDPLVVFGIIASAFSLLFTIYQSSTPTVLLPFLNQGDTGGLFPVSLPADQNDTLREYLGKSLGTIEDCLNHNDFSLKRLADEEFTLAIYDLSDIIICTEQYNPSPGQKRFPVKVIINAATGTIVLVYDPGVLFPFRVNLIQAHFQAIEAAILDGGTFISGLDILTDGEKVNLSGSVLPEIRPDGRTLIDLFLESVTKFPEHPAIWFEGKPVTYRELDQKSTRLASYFLEHADGVTSSVIALMMERSDLMMIAILAILKSGAAYVPIDPAYPEERIKYLLTASGSEMLITTSEYLFDVPFFDGTLFAIDIQLNDLTEQPDVNVWPLRSDDLAYIIFTSGSTGRPKGVEVCHSSVVNYLNWASSYYFEQNEKGGDFPLFTPVSFDLTITSIFVPLTRGKAIHIFGNEDVGQILSEIFSERGRADTVKLTPSHISLLAAMPATNTNVHTVIAGGEALRQDHISVIREKWPQIQIYNEYGPTEATVGCTATLIEDAVTIGRPIANTAIYILDQHLRLMPAGATGEIFIGGACLAKGYRGSPEQTAAAFLESPFLTGQKVYRTGDIGSWLEDGSLTYTGRKDTQVKIRGYRIETAEIEQIMLGVSGITEAAVVQHLTHGHGSSLVAFYTADDSFSGIDELSEQVKLKLPVYMLPALFFQLPVMPLTPNFKIDRKILSQLIVEHKDAEFIKPVSEIEQKLAEIFSEVLRREQVGLSDNFFAMGGDSIIGIQIVSRANMKGISITLKQLFTQLTIAELALVAKKNITPFAEQGLVAGKIEITPVHQWFFDQCFVQISRYSQAVILDVQGFFDAGYIQAALEKIVEHHDMLRMRVKEEGDTFEEYIPDTRHMHADFIVRDLGAVAGENTQQALLDDMATVQNGLDIFNGPVFRVRAYPSKDKGETKLLLTAHHLVIDGVSWRIVLEDLSTVYQQLRRGQSVSLPAKTSAFQTWAAAVAGYSGSDLLQEEIPYWTNVRWFKANALASDPAGKNSDNLVGKALSYPTELNEASTLSLLSAAHNGYHTNINDILLSALLIAFYKYTGQQSLLISMEGHGREELFDRLDITRTVGWFTSIYPVLLETPDITDPGTIIKSVKEGLRAIPNHGTGYGMLRYGNSTEEVKEALGRQPQPQIIFNYLGQSGQALPVTGEWKLSALQTGADQDKEQKRNYVIEINAIVADGKLMVDWVYSPAILDPFVVETIASDYLKSLQDLIEHCLNVENGNFTPSDFPESGLEQDQLDHLISQFKL